MVEMREELTFDDMVSITKALRILKPDMADYVCIGVEKPQIGDMNVVFHMVPYEDTNQESEVVMVSADLLLKKFGGTGNVAERNV
jgi:hypothetical protein